MHLIFYAFKKFKMPKQSLNTCNTYALQKFRNVNPRGEDKPLFPCQRKALLHEGHGPP